MKVRLPILLLLPLLALPAPGQGPSDEEIVNQVIASRPKGKRVLVMPKLFDELEGNAWEQGAQATEHGLAAWRDTYGRSGDDEFSVRQYFVPLKSWKQKNPRQMLDAARAQMADGKQAVLVEERDYTLDECPCRTFVVRRPATGRMLRLDYLLIYPDVYIVSYSGSEAGLKSERVARFFGSLRTEPAN